MRQDQSVTLYESDEYRIDYCLYRDSFVHISHYYNDKLTTSDIHDLFIPSLDKENKLVVKYPILNVCPSLLGRE